ncbi:hypothetical protein Q9189_007890 [Teloschistes chrysophthalmus]
MACHGGFPSSEYVITLVPGLQILPNNKSLSTAVEYSLRLCGSRKSEFRDHYPEIYLDFMSLDRKRSTLPLLNEGVILTANFDLEHNIFDSSAPSSYPDLVQQEPPSKSLLLTTRADRDHPALSNSGPTIVVHRSKSRSPLESIQKATVLGNEMDTPPSQPSNEWSSMKHNGSSDDIGRSLGPTTRPNSPARGLVPETVPYTLHITLDKEPFPTPLVGSIRLNDASDFQTLEKCAKDYVEDHYESELAGKTLCFRSSDCTIVGDYTDSHEHGLSSAEDWIDVCTVLENFFASNRHQRQHLHINRHYYTLLTRRISDESFASSKRDEIWGLFKKSFDNREYIPRKELTRMASKEMIRQIILEDPLKDLGQAEQEDFIQCVLRDGRKLLVMCVYAELPMRCLKAMMDAGHNDSTLRSNPFEDEDICHPRHAKCGPRFSNLLRCQGSFNAAEFYNVGEHKQLHLSTVLPLQYYPREEGRGGFFPESHETSSETEESRFDQDENGLKQRALCGSGAFSKVYRVRLDPAHHKLSTVKNADFALKVFIDRPLQTGASFAKEVRVLDELRKHSNESNDHIATHLATWTQDGRYYMLFPYAQCNLGQYMRRISFGNPTKRNTLWFLRQLLGLATALRQIHNLSGAESPAASSINLLAPAVKDLRKSGWHHDLRPENILYFRTKSYDDGEFYIADFGSGKVHTYRSGSNNTKSPNGTQTYEPPEFAKEGKTSRPYDMWSMGCVFLELLVWVIFDYRFVKAFANDRGGRRFPDSQTEFTDDDAFWQMDQSGNISLRNAVTDQITNLRDTIQHRGLIYFEKILDLVQRMLVDDRVKRLQALDLWDTLDRICKQAKLDMAKLKDDELLADVARESTYVPTYLPRLSTDAPDRRTPELMVSPTVTITAEAHDNFVHPAQHAAGGFLAASPVPPTSSPGGHRRNSSANSLVVSSRPRGLSDSSMHVQNGSPMDEMDHAE